MSNIELKSNVYLRQGDLSTDVNFLRQLRGEKSLRYLLEVLGKNPDQAGEIGLSEDQLQELASASKCLINDPYGGTSGLVLNESGREEIQFRCTNHGCEVYEECFGQNQQIEAESILSPPTEKEESLWSDALYELGNIIEAEIINTTREIGKKAAQEGKMRNEIERIMKELASLYMRLNVLKESLTEGEK